ncbi:SPOR domain-containing protein [Sphingobium sufflavum]|uniref:SPOR domain-containing protein n=1 Tax=Sphingobium sufflavum TaxID=1129547 RepID=UPI001F2A2299|nr:SPOR domain-containing protein [Sphingobium sufflavum]MCE7797994.1 SPOR domain-containing protein [Sphingobium sufflavum]
MPLRIDDGVRRAGRFALRACALPVFALYACALIPAVALAQPDQAGEPPRSRPSSRPSLDEVGYAGVGDPGGAPGAILATHGSLPVASFAEVTSLATGRTILVRIGAQGPVPGGRVLDLSCAAARQLGLATLPAPVRVRRVYPPDQEQVQLGDGKAVAERLASPPGLLSALRRKLPAAPRGGSRDLDCGLASPPAVVAEGAHWGERAAAGPSQTTKTAQPARTVKPSKPPRAKPAPLPAPVADAPRPAPSQPARPLAQPARPDEPRAKGPAFAIQVAALSDRGRAMALARSLGGYVQGAGGISRVRKGPYSSEAAARAALPNIRAKGFADAHVVPNEGR